MCEFEEKVKKNLEDILGTDRASGALPRIGLAVSGGADSIALLLAMSEILNSQADSKVDAADGSSLFVITVNHNIRPAEESRGDADFVLEVCERLRNNSGACKIISEAVELERGEVEREARSRGGGIEEAARYLRYAAFEKFVLKHKLNALCTAHNQNDQIETLLMRFLQGSSTEAAGGIKERRTMSVGKNAVYARPLLNITRSEIEAYVKGRGFSWRTDKTNLETDYLRNKIRLKLVPFLDENFNGWKKAVLSAAERAEEDSVLIESCVEKIPVSKNMNGVEISIDAFIASPAAVQRRVLHSACNIAGETARIPNQFINDVLSTLKNRDKGQCDCFTKLFAGVDIIFKKNNLFVKKHSECNTDFVFSDIIEKTGSFEFPFGFLDVYNYREQNGKKLVSVRARERYEESLKSEAAEDVSLPFCVRNARLGDSVLCADGSLKKLSDIFSDWQAAPEKRRMIPVIQLMNEKSQEIKAIFGGFLGFKDWIVKL